MVVLLNLYAHRFDYLHHFRAQILFSVHGVDREITALDARTMAKIAFDIIFGRVVRRFAGVELVESAVRIRAETNVVEDEEFRLGPEVRFVAYAGFLQVVLRPSWRCGAGRASRAGA